MSNGLTPMQEDLAAKIGAHKQLFGEKRGCETDIRSMRGMVLWYDLAVKEARRYSHNQITPEHFLLAFIKAYNESLSKKLPSDISEDPRATVEAMDDLYGECPLPHDLQAGVMLLIYGGIEGDAFDKVGSELERELNSRQTTTDSPSTEDSGSYMSCTREAEEVLKRTCCDTDTEKAFENALPMAGSEALIYALVEVESPASRILSKYGCLLNPEKIKEALERSRGTHPDEMAKINGLYEKARKLEGGI